jgi:hypothetical protein
MVYLKEDFLAPYEFEDIFSSSESSSSTPQVFSKLGPGSVYTQAYKLWPENTSTDFDSIFDSSVEILISELDALDTEIKEDCADFARIMQEILFTRLQYEFIRTSAKQSIKKILLLSINRK